MDKEIIEIAKRYAEKVKETMRVRMIVLYGSHVTGTPHKDSDIDIAVIVDEFQGDYLTASAGLFNLARDVNMRIEPVLLSRKHDKSGFLENVVRRGKIIYQSRKKAG
ncbi:MAG: nucleotidyltransferase domain-containing protein [Phycisphaerae bacterium]|nr:nucleotidyltransferase domain-containing protein [Phycisphaerae bacterium]